MSQSIDCLSCEENYDAVVYDSAMWLICPHCGARSPNPSTPAQRAKDIPPIAGTRLVALILVVVFSVLGTCLTIRVGLCLVPVLTGLVAGVLLMRSDEWGRLRGQELAAPTVLLLVLGVLVLLGVMVVAFATVVD